MKVRALTILSIAMITTISCDRIPFIGGGSDQTATDSTAVDSTDAATMDSTAAPESTAPDQPVTASPPEPVTTPPAPAPQPLRAPPQDPGEMPWTPARTGTINPGMSSAQVIETWGEPVAQRAHGNHNFMYFRNGCERRCGTFDLVIFEGDQVIDAVVRGFGHTYSGVSSSPATANAIPTPPTDTTGTIG